MMKLSILWIMPFHFCSQDTWSKQSTNLIQALTSCTRGQGILTLLEQAKTEISNSQKHTYVFYIFIQFPPFPALTREIKRSLHSNFKIANSSNYGFICLICGKVYFCGGSSQGWGKLWHSWWLNDERGYVRQKGPTYLTMDTKPQWDLKFLTFTK